MFHRAYRPFRSLGGIRAGNLQWAFCHRLFLKAASDDTGNDSVTRRVVMRVPEDEMTQVPAAGLGPRALFLHRKKSRKQSNEAPTLAVAPLAPDAHLSRIRRVMRELCRPRIDNHADGNVALGKLLPEQVHLRLLPGNAAFQSQRRIAGLIGIGVGNLAIRPGRALQVEFVAAVSQIKVIPAEPD